MAINVKIWTDGSGSSKNRCGGVGVYMEFDNGEKSYFRAGFTNTKTGRMELRAVIFALEFIEEFISDNIDISSVDINSDSQYAVLTASTWLAQWQKAGIIHHKKNEDYLRLLLDIKNKLKDRVIVKYNWVKGHAGNRGNEIADKLANSAYKIAKSEFIDGQIFDNGRHYPK